MFTQVIHSKCSETWAGLWKYISNVSLFRNT